MADSSRVIPHVIVMATFALTAAAGLGAFALARGADWPTWGAALTALAAMALVFLGAGAAWRRLSTTR